MILSEEEIVLPDSQKKFIESGWGSKVLNDVQVNEIVYESNDKKVNGYIAYPKSKKESYPLIIWNRGGSGKDGMIDTFLATGIFGEIASWGYLVLASQYRDEDEFGGNDVNDILSLFQIADSISFCDSSRIGMEGWSRGGMMTYKVLTKSDRVKCAVIISGLANLLRDEESTNGMQSVYKNLFGSTAEEEFTKRKKERSAVYFADKINKETRILLIHGTADTQVSQQDSIDMYKLLLDNGIECKLELVKDGDHYLKKNRGEIVKLRKDWFDKYLKSLKVKS